MTKAVAAASFVSGPTVTGLGHHRASARPLALLLNPPNPALVAQRAARRLPRGALLLLCAAYLIPGLLGRDPWRNADITAFGYMSSMAQGRAGWLAPSIAGVSDQSALLPYWLGAASIRALQPWVDAALAARLPFVALLAAVMMLIWYSAFHLARSDAAQPLAFAFGGEAKTVDYARAIADSALLALIASLGLLQLGHETTPELGQLAGTAMFLYGLAAQASRRTRSRLATLCALPVVAASGAPAIAVALGLLGAWTCRSSSDETRRRLAGWIVAATLLAATLATAMGAWGWRVAATSSVRDAMSLVRLLLWFTWPLWPLVAWTLWRWRRQWFEPHIVLPCGVALVALAACLAMGGSARALMLALPALAVLAAFALPTLPRSAAAAIDWFSVFFFSVAAAAIWVIYASVQTGIPAKPAANVAKLAPGFESSFSAVALGVALLASLAWLGLVRWRTSRHPHALWKSLVLPAAGVALNWLLLLSLWLPMLDYARSYRPLVALVSAQVPRQACIVGRDLPKALQAALEHFGGYRVDGVQTASSSECEFLIRLESAGRPRTPPAGWSLVARNRQPTDRRELVTVYRRASTP